jgi:hypothetical protein
MIDFFQLICNKDIFFTILNVPKITKNLIFSRTEFSFGDLSYEIKNNLDDINFLIFL